MSTVYLKYITWNDGTQQWDTSAAHSFSCLDFDEYDIKDIIVGKTLRQVNYVHKNAEKSKWIVVIGANVLYDNTEWAWIQTFFNAERWMISDDNITFTEVVLEADVLEKERTGGHKNLRKISFELIQKNPS